MGKLCVWIGGPFRAAQLGDLKGCKAVSTVLSSFVVLTPANGILSITSQDLSAFVTAVVTNQHLLVHN